MGLPAAMGKSFRWRFRRSGILAENLIGRGMVFPGVSNGARVSFRGVQTSAGKSKMVLFPNSQVVFKAQLVQGKGTLSGRQLYALCGTHYFL